MLDVQLVLFSLRPYWEDWEVVAKRAASCCMTTNFSEAGLMLGMLAGQGAVDIRWQGDGYQVRERPAEEKGDELVSNGRGGRGG